MFENILILVVVPLIIGVATNVVSEWLIRKFFDLDDKQ